MGERNRDRQLREARTSYLAAVRRLNTWLQRFDNSGTAMEPGPNPANPIPWTSEQVQIIAQTAVAFRDVVERRREWDGLRRSFLTQH